ncbi:MAG: hypothetical protein ACF8MF_04140 [Phycisphaerales bacterium JB052]
MCPVLLPSFELPSQEAVQSLLDAQRVDCEITHWAPTQGMNHVSALLRNREVTVQFELRELQEQDQRGLLDPEYFEGMGAVYEVFGGTLGPHACALVEYIESALSVLMSGVIYFGDSPLPDKPWKLRDYSKQKIEEFELLEFVSKNYAVNEKFHPSEMPLPPGFTQDTQRWTLSRVDYQYLDSDRSFRSLNQDGGYRWLTREGLDHVENLQPSSSSSQVNFPEAGA